MNEKESLIQIIFGLILIAWSVLYIITQLLLFLIPTIIGCILIGYGIANLMINFSQDSDKEKVE